MFQQKGQRPIKYVRNAGGRSGRFMLSILYFFCTTKWKPLRPELLIIVFPISGEGKQFPYASYFEIKLNKQTKK